MSATVFGIEGIAPILFQCCAHLTTALLATAEIAWMKLFFCWKDNDAVCVCVCAGMRVQRLTGLTVLYAIVV